MTRKLLLADDSTTIQRVIELTFSGEDVTVVAVGDGEQAIARIPIEKPDIVLADIGMPKRNGYEVAAFVKEHPDFSHVPVLLLAGAFEPVDEARAKQVKADGVLVKPFEPQHVIARVRELTGLGPPIQMAPPPASVPLYKVPPPQKALPLQKVAPPQKALMPVANATPAPVKEPGRSTAPEPSLDDYFDRLDAAFATLGNSNQAPAPEPPPAHDDIFGTPGVPTIDDLLGGSPLSEPPPAHVPPMAHVAPPPIEPPDANPTIAPAQPAASAASTPLVRGGQGEKNVIAEMFNVLFAVEQGERDAATVRIGPQPAPVMVTDDLVNQIARRVLERLGPDSARHVVADVVSDVAERLVREEIARIRKLQSE
jgi:CheY-like chemotaxis protein